MNTGEVLIQSLVISAAQGVLFPHPEIWNPYVLHSGTATGAVGSGLRLSTAAQREIEGP